jgi:hypothetical protein
VSCALDPGGSIRMSKERAAKIANSPGASKRGGKNSGKKSS